MEISRKSDGNFGQASICFWKVCVERELCHLQLERERGGDCVCESCAWCQGVIMDSSLCEGFFISSHFIASR